MSGNFGCSRDIAYHLWYSRIRSSFKLATPKSISEEKVYQRGNSIYQCVVQGRPYIYGYRGKAYTEVGTRHNPQITMVPRYLIIIMLPIFAGFAAAASLERLSLMSQLGADWGDDANSCCEFGGCCSETTVCCDGT